jgi:hypothetical protein
VLAGWLEVDPSSSNNSHWKGISSNQLFAQLSSWLYREVCMTVSSCAKIVTSQLEYQLP